MRNSGAASIDENGAAVADASPAPVVDPTQAAAVPGVGVAGGPANGEGDVRIEDVVTFAETQLRGALGQLDAVRRRAVLARARLEAQIQTQRRRAENAEGRARQAEAGRQQMEEVLEERRINCAELTTVLHAAEYRLAELEKTVELRDQEVESLRQQRAGETDHARAQREQIEKLAAANREAIAERRRLEAETTRALDERSVMSAEVDELTRRLAKQRAEMDALGKALRRARERAVALERQAPDVAAASGSDKPSDAQVAAIERELAAAREREHGQEEEIRTLRARGDDFEEALGAEKKQLAAVERELAAARDDIRQRVETGEMLEHQRSELQTQLNALMEETQQLRDELRGAQQRQGQSGERSALLEARVSELERALLAGQEHEAILQATAAELQDILQKEQVSVGLLRAEGQSQARLRQTLEGELLEARARASELEARLSGQTQQHLLQLAKSTDRCRALEAERDELQQSIANLEAARDRAEREREQLRRRVEMERQKGEMARLQAKLEEVELRHPDAIHTGGEGSSTRGAVPRRDAAEAARLAEVAGPVVTDLPIVAIGASTGGPAALGTILPLFAFDSQACFVIVQHMPPGYTAELASCLAQQAEIKVLEARHGDLLRPGVAYVAPGGHHLEIFGGRIRLTAGAPVNKHRPSVDVLFRSLVPVARRVFAVLLSGMGNDGVDGMTRLLAAGADTIVQDEGSSVVWGMPGAAVKAGCVRRQFHPKALGSFLLQQVAERTSVADGADDRRGID